MLTFLLFVARVVMARWIFGALDQAIDSCRHRDRIYYPPTTDSDELEIRGKYETGFLPH